MGIAQEDKQKKIGGEGHGKTSKKKKRRERDNT